MQYQQHLGSAVRHIPYPDSKTAGTGAPRSTGGTGGTGSGRSFLGFRFVPHDATHGPHISEDFTITRPGGFVTRGSVRTAIHLPPAVAQKMSVDAEFRDAVLRFCTDRRAALEKATVVYDPARDLGIERLFPKWLYVSRDGKQCRDAMTCAMPPAHILELASLYPKGFTSTDAWRAWCAGLPPLPPAAAQGGTPTDTVPPRIAALVLSDERYFTTPEYRAWIGRAKQRKREEIIARELVAMYEESTAATAADGTATAGAASMDGSAAHVAPASATTAA